MRDILAHDLRQCRCGTCRFRSPTLRPAPHLGSSPRPAAPPRYMLALVYPIDGSGPMIRQVVDRHELHRYVEAVRDQLAAPQLQDAAAQAAETVAGEGDPVAKLRAALPPVEPQLASSGARPTNVAPFMSPDPIQSLLQSTLEGKLREQGVTPEEAP